ncbi:N-acetyltransferase NAT13 [Sparassis latifolia]
MSSATQRSPTRVSLSSLTPNNLGTVRKLNSVLFPIKYSEKFYQDILLPEVEDFCKLSASMSSLLRTVRQFHSASQFIAVYYNDVPVGTICCRMETRDGQSKLYLMTMGILAPYRSRGLGSKALQQVIEAAASHSKPKISSIYLHVQISNDSAKSFYERQDFREVGVHQGYYKKIVPRDAWILERAIEDVESSEQR